MSRFQEWKTREASRLNGVFPTPIQELSTSELLAYLFRDPGLAHALIKQGSIAKLAKLPIEELIKVRGMGLNRAEQLMAAFELGRRVTIRMRNGLHSHSVFTWAEDAFNYVHPLIGASEVEKMLVLHLNARHQLQRFVIVSQGSATSCEVHPREVFCEAVRTRAAAIILAHVHPSGNPEPSQEDQALTQRLVEAGRMLGIAVLDHLIVTSSSYVSLAERGLI